MLLVPSSFSGVSDNPTVVDEGDNVVLHCKATGKPQPQVKWRHLIPSGTLLCSKTFLCSTILADFAFPNRFDENKFLEYQKKSIFCGKSGLHTSRVNHRLSVSSWSFDFPLAGN